jgi:rifampicin phosphotransferase
MLATRALRNGVLKLGRTWMEEGRLDAAEQMFGLTLEDISNGCRNKGLDLRKILADHVSYRERYKVASLATVFDSRGRVIRPPAAPAAENELVGIPISGGTFSGTVKVLHSADEKPLLAGDVMVTRATDPGWTPLFAVAGAVVLEVGGVLQHGALVAREYGLPCVSGIENATQLLQDGMTVEVNGTEGRVRILVPLEGLD